MFLTIPAGFVGTLRYVEDGYGAQYDNTSDINSSGNPSQIFISEVTETNNSNYKSSFSYFQNLSKSKNSSMKEFDYNGMRGAVIESTNQGNVDHDLILKDSGRLLKISTRDGTKTHFSSDDLISMLKTFVRAK